MSHSKIAIAALIALGSSATHAAPALTKTAITSIAVPAILNEQTAPDAVSRSILAHRLQRLEEGAPAGQDVSATIHRNMPQILEQNFAQLDATRVTKLLDSLSDRELADIAQIYVTASFDSSHTMRLLPVLASRLDGVRLARVARFFGHDAVYESIVAYAPAKVQEFSDSASYYLPPPVPRAALSLPSGHVTPNAGPNIDMTPGEIYMGFRTGTFGAELGVAASLYEAVNYMAGPVAKAGGTGWAVGTGITYIIQTYDLPLWDTISGTVGTAAENITNATSELLQGQFESSMSTLFDLSPPATYDMQHYGGDFQVCGAWEYYYDFY